MKEFDLNIEKVLDNWGVEHAIREVIANALDEQTITNTKEIEIFADKDNNWHIRDYGRGLKYLHLTQNENVEKLTRDNLIGKFGVGLKDALATFNRNDKPIKIISKFGIITLGKSKKHGFDDILTLHAYIDEPIDSDFVGTDFVIGNCSKIDINRAKMLFLKFSNVTLLENTNYGEIYGTSGLPANIYFNGVKVAEEENFLFSYNITSMTKAIKNAMNRERTNVARTAYTERIKAILLQVKNENVIELLSDNLNKFSSGTLKDELKWSDIATHVVKLLNAKENVVFVTPKELEVTSNEQLDILKASGKKVVFVPNTVKEKAKDNLDFTGNKISTFETVFQSYRDSFQYDFVKYEELSIPERLVFDYVSYIANSYKCANFINKVCISTTVRPNETGEHVNGVWDNEIGKIVILRDQLKSIESFTAVLIHELIHARKGLIDMSREFEQELSRIIGRLFNAYLNKSFDIVDNLDLG